MTVVRASDIPGYTFRVAFRGYNRDAVDRFKDRMSLALETWEKGGKTPELMASDVETVTFRTGFRGYDIAEVDDFLDQAWYTFAGYEG